MALSGVRSSWLMLARNCDLCWLASASWRLLSWISSNSRTFSMAITAWSAKVVTSSICLSVNGRTSARSNDQTPIGTAFAQQRHAEHGAEAALRVHSRHRVFRIGQHVRHVNDRAFEHDASDARCRGRARCGWSLMNSIEPRRKP